ncbi:CBD9-like protein, partial [Rhizodiscina lignyota]
HSTDVNFTFTLTAVQKTGDLFFRLSVPNEWSWVAVGTGSQMKSALIFLTYANTNGKDIVLSPRIATGHSEPSYNSKINLSQVDPPSGDSHPNGVHDDTWFTSGICRNCTAPGLGANSIDLTSTSQPFIFAFGPQDKNPDSNSLSAPLRRHTAYGYFEMDMTKATVTSTDDDDISKITVPALGTGSNGASIQGDIHDDHETSSPIHAVLMCFAFLVAFPLGVFAARIMGKVAWHQAVQSVGMIIVIGGMGAGLYAGKFYNRSKHVTNGHQIFGLLIVALILVQWVLGFIHHRHYVKTQQPFKNGLFVKIHRVLGPVVMAAGVINGAFGFRFALTRWNLIYVPLVLVVIILLIASAGIKFFLGKKHRAKEQPTYGNAPPVYPNAPAPPYSGVGTFYPPPAQPYNDNNSWQATRSDIQLTSFEPERPKQMV